MILYPCIRPVAVNLVGSGVDMVVRQPCGQCRNCLENQVLVEYELALQDRIVNDIPDLRHVFGNKEEMH